FKDVIINIAWLGEQISNTLGDGTNYNLNIHYSDEGTQALETGGGIFNALPLLGNEPFLVVNGDVWTDYPFQQLHNYVPEGLAHLILVTNPAHNTEGDFYLHNNQLCETGDHKYTFSGIGVYQKDFFSAQSGGAFPLAPLIRQHITNTQISGELYTGEWDDIGTLERLEQRIKKQALKEPEF
ncbi:MAG: hypothetical protein OEZ38_14185, partial [Gammaproteobacteria bacterium]|nr:hypothetical protein [Gammaproteobacteria bacterium]